MAEGLCQRLCTQALLQEHSPRPLRQGDSAGASLQGLWGAAALGRSPLSHPSNLSDSTVKVGGLVMQPGPTTAPLSPSRNTKRWDPGARLS